MNGFADSGGGIGVSESRDGRRTPHRLLWLILPVIMFAATMAIAVGSAAAAATLEGTWEIPTDPTNAPAGCSGFGGPECTAIYVGNDKLEMTAGGPGFTGAMKSGGATVGSISAVEEAAGKVRIFVTGLGAYLFNNYEFIGTLAPDGNTMGGACPPEFAAACFHWSNGGESRRYAWDAVRVGALAPSTTTVECPSSGAGKFQCSVVVTGSAEGKVPTGTVSFGAAEGTFVPPSCTLSPVIGGVGCSSQFTLPPSAKGPIKVTASYGGDKVFAASKGEFAIVSSVSIGDVNVLEPNKGTSTANFPVTLSAASAGTVTVHYKTLDGKGATGAIAGHDYEAASGTVTFSPGETSKTIPVTIKAAAVKGRHSFTVSLSEPVGTEISSGTATGTIIGPSPMVVTIAVPADIDIEETEAGAVPQNIPVTVTVKNRGLQPIENVTVPNPLTIGWHGPAPINALPIRQVEGPSAGGKPVSPNVGTLAPGAQSHPVPYVVQVEGDGHFDIQALVTGAEGGLTVRSLGLTTINPTSQLLVMKNEIGAEVHSQTNPALIQAGTHFLANVRLENRSYVDRLEIEPYFVGLSGNAAGGSLYSEKESTAFSPPTGALSEVHATPVIVLAPREKRTYFAAVGTSATDAFTQSSVGGGTRATVTFPRPEVATLDAADESTPVKPDRVVLTPGSESLNVGIDDSVAPPPPFKLWQAQWAWDKGVAFALWNATYGAVRGLYDLNASVRATVLNIPSATLNAVEHLAETWRALEPLPPGVREEVAQAIEEKVIVTFAEAPWALQKAAGELRPAINKLVSTYFTKITNDWYAGDWRQAITDVADTSVSTAALFVGPGVLKGSKAGATALELAAGTLSRSEPAAEALAVETAAEYAKADEALNAAGHAIVPAATGVAELAKVTSGYQFKLAQLRKYVGMTEAEAKWLADFCEKHRINVVLRSRAEESIRWISEKGAMLKPSWIKSKGVTWADVKYLGYSDKDVGRVVMRKPPPLGQFEARLTSPPLNLTKGSPEYATAIERWTERNSTYAKEIKQMNAWNKQGDLKGKWPFQESAIDPRIQADHYKDYKFRLRPDKFDAEALVPEIFNPKTGKFGSITGDIDLVSVTKADGTSFTQEEYVKILKKLAKSPLGIQHPDSTVWIKNGEFWFKQKEDYLASKGNVQFGGDGKIRSVQFNQALSDPTRWTPFKYRIVWDGGYKVGPGQ